MTFQIIKDLASSKTEFFYYLWAMENGEQDKCLAAKSSLEALEKVIPELTAQYIKLKNFKPELIKEIEI